MDLSTSQTGHPLIGFAAVPGPLVREPALHPIAGVRAEKENRTVTRLGNFVFEVAQFESDATEPRCGAKPRCCPRFGEDTAAKALGLQIPDRLLALADEVIE